MTEKGKRSVVILENTAVTAARNIVHGVMRYAATHPDWEITVYTGHPSEREEAVRIGRPDGIISGFTDEPANPIPVRYRTTTPTVFTCARPFKGMSAPFVELDMDDSAIARTAAEALLRTHVKSFGFLGLRQPMPWEKVRLDRFRRTIQKAGFKVSTFTPLCGDSVDVNTERSALADWLRSLKKPCGIFAVTDRRAKFLLESCRACGIPVPDQVKIIGVDNDEIVCECARPTLTSVAPNFAKAGFAAAEALDRLMDGRKTARHLTIGVRGVVERLSASDLSGSGNRVSRALELIRQKAFAGVTVPMIAQTVGCSVRLLEKDFQSVIGRSIVDETNRVRLAKVQDLLRNTSLNETEVASAAGFGSAAYLRNLFRKRFGLTMRAWRQQHAKTVPL